MTEREIMMKKLASYQFMVDDLQLYLDTHPYDSQSVEKMNEYNKTLNEIREAFESKYGPLTADESKTNRWAWVKAPWPWENEEDN